MLLGIRELCEAPLCADLFSVHPVLCHPLWHSWEIWAIVTLPLR